MSSSNSSFRESLFNENHPLTSAAQGTPNTFASTSTPEPPTGVNPRSLTLDNAAQGTSSSVAGNSTAAASTSAATISNKKKTTGPRDSSTDRVAKKPRVSEAMHTPGASRSTPRARPNDDPMNSPVPGDAEKNWEIRANPNKSAGEPKWLIRVTATDGDKSQWPDEHKRVNDRGGKTWDYFELQDTDSPKSLLWRKVLGEHLAIRLGKVDQDDVVKGDWLLEDFPTDYQLFIHYKSLGDGRQPRTDHYLFGAPSKFRSINEFRPHIEALARGTFCQCKYCSGSKLQRDVNKGMPVLTPQGAPRAVSPKGHRSYNGPYGHADRERDLGGAALTPFRRGELVWLKLAKPILPSGVAAENVKPDQKITHWPAVVLDQEAVIPGENPGSRRKVRLLSVQDTLIVSEQDFLPWQAYTQPPAIFAHDLSRAASVEHVYDLEALKRSLNLPTDGDIMVNDAAAPVKSALGNYRRPKLEDLKTVDDAITTLALSLQIAAHVITFWCHLEPFKDPRGHNMTFYQGLFWGPEKIWTGDLVRLLTPRKDLPSNILEPSRGNDNSVCFFLKIRSLSRNEQNKAIASGDIYELATARWFAENEKPAERETMSVSDKAVKRERYFPKPPAGYKWRLLTDTDGEHIFEIFHCAGRFYNDLSDYIDEPVPTPDVALPLPPSPAQSPPSQQSSASAAKKDSQLTTPAEKARALAGLTSGNSLYLKCRTQMDSRKEMLNRAESTAQSEMQTYFERNLKEA